MSFTIDFRRSYRPRSSGTGVAAHFTSRAEQSRFAGTWCAAVDRMSDRQLRGAAEAMLTVWQDVLAMPDPDIEAAAPLATAFACAAEARRLADAHRRRSTSGGRGGAPVIEKRIDWLAKTFALDRDERAIIALVARHALFEAWERLIDALPGPSSGCTAESLALASGLTPPRVEAKLATGSRLWGTGLVDAGSDGTIAANELLVRVARARVRPASLPRLLMPAAPPPTLDWSDFAHLGPQRDLAERLAAHGGHAAILLYGPPGTGKTEFARLLAARLGRDAVFAGLSDSRGQEPSRRERLAHLVMLRALTQNDDRRLVVMDEADDVLGQGRPDGHRRGEGSSKLWLNRLIEGGGGPTVWIVNEPRLLDPALLRRMSLALSFPAPSQALRRRIVARQARAAQLALSDAETASVAALPAAPAVLATAIDGARKTGGGAAAAQAIGAGLVEVLHGRPPEPVALPAAYDAALAVADCDLEALAARLAASQERGWSLLLSGPSGTGKSAYVRHLAERLGLELVVRGASDLFGPYVGETEGRIAAAFAETARIGGLLLIDEADDVLFDRQAAERCWERRPVNEMLRQMEALRAPFAATTNLTDRLDPATGRRFTLHARFRHLDDRQAAALFARWFDQALPAGAVLEGQTPGDYDLVHRRARLLGERDPAVLVRWLQAEADARGHGARAVGFAV